MGISVKSSLPKPEQDSPIEILNASQLQVTKNVLQHQQEVTSLLISMKPKILSYYFRRVTKKMVKKFFLEIRQEMREAK